MSVPIAVILRFKGDPDDLLGRFEQARKSWIEAQDDGYEPPVLFAVFKEKEGIVVVNGWENARDHRAFGEQMGPHLQAVGMGRPDHIEHLKIARLGWDRPPAGPPRSASAPCCDAGP